MSLTQQILSRFYKTKTFQGLLSNFQKETAVEVRPIEELKTLAKISQDKIELENSIPTLITKSVSEEITKLQIMQRNEALRYRYPNSINQRQDPDRKPYSDLPFSYLRRMATVYPIARACINRRIRQLTQLEWDVTTVDEVKDEKGYEEQIKIIKQWMKQPFGPTSRMRKLLTVMVDDVLTLDAVSFEKQKTRGGEFMWLIPIDPTTIQLRVTETGGTPLPPDTAYVQIIGGRKIAEFTTDEIIYDMINPRSYTPYGQSPLESLIIQVESAIRGALYNLDYLKESNVPEGFVTLPEEIAGSKDRVEEWQFWFDAMVAGDKRMMHRLKILPGGSEYTAAKKPEDMAFERFEIWMLHQTCAMFEIQPQEIGITLNVNKATGESQQNIGNQTGLLPLYQFIKEIMDDVIQTDFGQPNLQLIARNINPPNRKEEAEIAKTEISMGALGVDEYRAEQGREPLGIEPYISTTSGPLFISDLKAGTVGPAASAKLAEKVASQPKPDPFGGGSQNGSQSKKGEFLDADDVAEYAGRDLRNWRKAALWDLKRGRQLRTEFASDYIPSDMHTEIAEGLTKCGSKDQINLLFKRFIDPELVASMTLLKYAADLREQEEDELHEEQ